MAVPALITLTILLVAVALFASGRLRADLVALLVLVGLGATGVLQPQEAFTGFSRSAVITIVAIFVLARGVTVTGASERLGLGLVRLAGASEQRLISVVMLAGALLSLFMNNIAAASLLLPAVTGAAKRKGVNPARLLMPLAFGTILGGMATLFTTTNIVISGLLRQEDLPGFGVLDFAPVGLPVLVAGTLYMVLWGRHLLPAQSAAERFAPPASPDLADVYRLNERLFRARIPTGSYLDGRPLAQSTFREIYNLSVVALERRGQVAFAPAPDTVLHAGDIVTLEGSLEDFRARDVPPYLEILPDRKFRGQDVAAGDIVVLEAVLAPRATLLGRTLKETGFRDKYGFTALAIWREGRPIRRGLASLELHFGDALLLQGPRERLRLLRAEPDLILLGPEGEAQAPPARPGKMWLALTIMLVSLVAASIQAVPMAEALLAGGLAMVLAGVLSMDEAYSAVEVRAVILVAGMLPMGLALAKTGLAGTLATHLVATLGPLGPRMVLAGLFLLATLLTQVMNGPVAAAILGPLAIQAAAQLAIDPRSLAMGVALGTSMAFLTPLGHPVNILVMGPGGYRFADYLKVGLPMTVILTVVVLLVLPVFWPV